MSQSRESPAEARAGVRTSQAANVPVARTAAHTVHRTTIAALLDGASELVIEHAGREYRLRLTQNGKLILTA